MLFLKAKKSKLINRIPMSFTFSHSFIFLLFVLATYDPGTLSNSKSAMLSQKTDMPKLNMELTVALLLTHIVAISTKPATLICCCETLVFTLYLFIF